jgi:benzoate-CoA ligase family protein
MAMSYNAARDIIQRRPGVAIYFEDEVITYDQLYDSVNRYANRLQELYRDGSHIMIVSPDRPEYLYMFWGSIRAGMIPVLVNTMLTDLDIDNIHMDCQPAAVFDESGLLAFDQEATNTAECDAASDEDECFVLYSSGTTGYLKQILHKHEDLRFTSDSYASTVLELTEQDVCLSAAKLFFAYGLGNSSTFPFCAGASVALISDRSSVKTMFDAIERYRPTVYFGVPTLYAHQLATLRQRSRDTSSLRLCVSAGEPLPGKLYEEWLAVTGVPVLDGIGTTEALHIFISNTRADHRANCSGVLMPGWETSICDIQGNEVEDGVAGHLWIKGDSTPTGGWIDTGDMFIREGDHYFYQGRSGDMIKSGGIWVSPFEVEACLMEHDDVLEAGVVACLDHNNLTKPKAYVVLHDGVAATNKLKIELKRWCIERIAHGKHPHSIEFMTRLPKTSTGKVQRFKLRAIEAIMPDA